jgi:hypothetical protein
MSDPWAEYETPRQAGDYPEPFKWEPVGVAIVGTITNIRKTNFDGKDVPELYILTDDGERSVLCGQYSLLTQLLEKRPQIGDRIAIKYTAPKPLGGGKTAKVFEVAVGDKSDAAPSAPKTAADLL